MSYLLRVLVTWLRSRRQPRIRLLDPLETPMRVWLADLDTNRHVNNGAYLTLMDFGRFDLLMRAGIFRTLWRRGWTPIVVAETIQFRRSLQWGQRFRLHTQLVGWTDKDFFIQQTFRRQGSIYAQGVIKGRFVQRDRGTVPVAELLALAGQPDAVSPPLPDWIRQWNASLDAARAAIRAAEGASSSV